MTIAYSTDWEIRTTGDYSNGGGFNRESGGTDYTQQDVAQLALTDCATSGVGSTTLTSATGGFTAAMVGNIINLSAGTNLTANWYEITAYTDTNTVTIDRAPDDGVGGVSGATGKVGGAMSWPPPDVTDGGPNVSYNKFWIKHGTYTLTNTTISAENGPISLDNASVEGFENVRGDMGSKPVFSAGTQVPSIGTAIFRTATSFNGIHITNIKIDGVDNTRTFSGFTLTDYRNFVQHCEAVNCQTGFAGNNNSARFCKASNCQTGFASFKTEFCVAHDCTSVGINNYINEAYHCIVYNCPIGYYMNGGADTVRCIADNCSSYGIYHYASYGNSLENLVTNCGTGIFFRGIGLSSDKNYLYNNSADVVYGSNNPINRYVSYDSTSITSDPYTDSANGDYTINNNETGGRPYRQLLENGESIARTFYPPSLPEKQDLYARELTATPLFEFHIGSGAGRDYATLTDFFAAFDNTLIDVNASTVLVTCHNDTDNDEYVVASTNSLLISAPSNCIKLIITCADDSWHKGEFGKGCVIRASGPYGYLVQISDFYCEITLKRLVIDGDSQFTNYATRPVLIGVIDYPDTVVGFGINLDSLIVRGTDGSEIDTRGFVGIYLHRNRESWIKNCIVYNILCSNVYNSGQVCYGIHFNGGATGRADNCVVYNIKYGNSTQTVYGIVNGTSTAYNGGINNSIVMETTNFATNNTTSINNLVTDDSTGTHQSTVATEFVDAPNGDFRLKPGATSVGLGPTTKAQIEDITGNRRRSVVAHDAGAFNNISGYDYDYDVAVPTADPTGLTTVFPFRYLVEDDFDDGTGPVAHPLRGN